ncbi:MAG: hypothetical protein FJZ75_10590 [Bacteroidetes bacterium]|nr:hypothetical protein [Bacteroidota bacterium]
MGGQLHGCVGAGLNGFMDARVHGILGCTDLWLREHAESWIYGFVNARTNAQGCTLC